MIYIVEVEMAGGATHQHIAKLLWVDGDERAWATRQQMVDFLGDQSNHAYVHNGAGQVEVFAVLHANPQFVRTHRDGTPTDNLLYLPGGPYYRG
jgi:hypothetical protein